MTHQHPGPAVGIDLPLQPTLVHYAAASKRILTWWSGGGPARPARAGADLATPSSAGGGTLLVYDGARARAAHPGP